MKRISALTSAAVALGMLFIPLSVASADQTFHTVKASFHSTNPIYYPLKDGFVKCTHMNGPVNFELKEFQLHGSRPNTQYFIYREIAEMGGINNTMYSGFSFWTDKNGEGHISTPLAPDNLTLEGLKAKGITQLTMTNVLFDGLSASGGSRAYVADTYVTLLDFKWTP